MCLWVGDILWQFVNIRANCYEAFTFARIVNIQDGLCKGVCVCDGGVHILWTLAELFVLGIKAVYNIDCMASFEAYISWTPSQIIIQ